MDLLKTIILGIVQGATEFLPISSSAHLVIGQTILEMQSSGIMLEIVLHIGTLLSVLVYYRHDLLALITGMWRRDETGTATRYEIFLLAVGTIPAVAVALMLGDIIEGYFESARFAGTMLLVTTLVLLSSRWLKRSDAQKSFGWKEALLIGLAQSIAILPGISRSGMTIVTGLWLGLSGERAARFSFLLAIPVILGAGIFKFPELGGAPAGNMLALAGGFLAAMLVGYVVISWLLAILRKGKLYYFAGYTLLAGLLVIFSL